MNAIVKVGIPALEMSEGELIGVLSASVYPGAKPESIKLAIAYCRGAHLDPLQKPVHIVPMDVKSGRKDGNKDIYEKRDVIMPGIGLYRVQAARTSEYAGMTEPEFGPAKTFNYKDKDDGPDQKLDYPEWCKVTVRRHVGGQIVEFTAKEYWLENYATAGNWTKAPNKMWKKRPFGQIAKCAEAQALRKAFPEVGAAPTAEEMEGKIIDVDGGAPPAPTPPALPQSRSAAAAPAATAAPAGGEPEKADATAETGVTLLSTGELAHLKKKLEDAALTEVDVKTKFGVPLAELPAARFKDVKTWIANPAA
jgi:phage recombination protein Bet